MRKITKFFIVALFFLGSTHLSFGQLTFGPRIGLNLATVAGVNTNAKFKPGLHIGGYARLGDKVAFQPELLFSMKGYSFKNGTYKESQSLYYVDIPLLVTFGRKFKFVMGAQPSILLAASYKYKYGSASAVKTENKDLFNTIDMAVVAGFELELESGLNFGYRFNFGTMRVFEPEYYKTVLNINMQFTVGYTIGKE